MADWLNILDVDLAARNVRTDIYGDWQRDPWDWPELEWVAGSRTDLLAARLDSHEAFAAFPLDVAKENFFTRPAIVFDIGRSTRDPDSGRPCERPVARRRSSVDVQLAPIAGESSCRPLKR